MGFQAQTGGIDLAPENGQFLRRTTCHMDGRLRDTSTMSRKKLKICHIGRHFIKVPQTVAWVTVNTAVWINSAGLGVDPQENPAPENYRDYLRLKLRQAAKTHPADGRKNTFSRGR